MAFAGAFGKHSAAVLFRDRLHNEQAQSGSFHMRQRAVADAVEALEDALHIVGWDADTMVPHAEHKTFFIRRSQAHAHIHVLAGIFDGIVEQIDYRSAEFLGVSV